MMLSPHDGGRLKRAVSVACWETGANGLALSLDGRDRVRRQPAGCAYATRRLRVECGRLRVAEAANCLSIDTSRRAVFAPYQRRVCAVFAGGGPQATRCPDTGLPVDCLVVVRQAVRLDQIGETPSMVSDGAGIWQVVACGWWAAYEAAGGPWRAS